MAINLIHYYKTSLARSILKVDIFSASSYLKLIYMQIGVPAFVLLSSYVQLQRRVCSSNQSLNPQAVEGSGHLSGSA